MTGAARRPEAAGKGPKPAAVRAARAGSVSAGTQARARLIDAARAIASEAGFQAVTVTAIVPRARVSSKTFYEQFDSAEGCFLAAYEEGVAELRAVAMPIYRRPGPWADRVRAALGAFLAHLDDQPQLASFMFLEAQKAGPAVQQRREQAQQMLTLIVDSGRSAAVDFAPPELTDALLVGGGLAVIRARLNAPAEGTLSDLLNELMAAITFSYEGPEAASRELTRPSVAAPPPAGRSSPALGNIPVRLTYRTARVMRAVAEQPGSSNRDVADRAGITDQGQISRMLARLQQLELIVTDRDAGSVAPNRWCLTPYGEEVEQAVRHEFRQYGS